MDLSIVFCVSSPEGIYSKYPSLIRLSEPGWTSIPKKGSILQKSSGLKPSSPMDGWYIYIYIHTHINAYIYIYTHRYYNNVTATWLEWRIGLRYAELFGSVNYLSPSMFFFFPIWQILQFWLVWTLAIAYGYPRIFPLHPIKSHEIFKHPSWNPIRSPKKASEDAMNWY